MRLFVPSIDSSRSTLCRSWRSISPSFQVVSRLTLFFALLLVLFVLESCGGKKETKKVSPEVMTAREALNVANQLKDAYTGKDKAALKQLCTKKGYLALIGSMNSVDHADITFTLRWTDIEKGKVILYINWEGTWFWGNNKVNEKGLVAFVFTGKPLRLDEILRSNPFDQPLM
jgi:hypothetical protein